MALQNRVLEQWMAEKSAGWSRFERVSVAAGFLGSAGVLAIAVSLSDVYLLLPSVLIVLALTLVAALGTWLVRLAVFGKVTSDADACLSARASWMALSWLAIKFGFVFATLYLFIAAGVALVAGWSAGFLIEAAVLLALIGAIGNLILASALNVSLIRSTRRSRADVDIDI